MPAIVLPPASPRPNRGNRVGLLGLLLVTFALRIIALDRLGLAYDEAASALMARARPTDIIAFHWNAAFEHPPLWALLLHGWSQLAGQSEFALRLLPAFAGTLLIPILWRLVLTIWPNHIFLAFTSALFVALAPVLVYYSQEARMYTLVVYLMLVSTYLVLRLRERSSWWRVFAFWLSSWLMLGLHYYSALALAIQALTLVIDALYFGSIRRMPWRKLLLAYVGALLPVAAWMLFSPGFQTTLTVVLARANENPVSWQYFLGDLWRELTFGSIRWQPTYAEWGYALAPFVALGTLLALLRPGQGRITRLGVWLLIALVLLPILSGTLFLRTLVPRYILWVVPLFYTLSAIPASMLWRRFWPASILIVLVIVGVDVLALQYYFGPYRKSDYRAMTTYLQSRGDPQREILLLEAPRQHLLAKYYLPTAWEAHPMPTVPLPAFWPVTAPLLVPEEEDDRIQGWLRERAGLWVSYTSEAEVDRGEFLAKYLTAVSYREHCTQWLDVRLCHYVSPHHLTPTPIHVRPTQFGGELAVVGAQGAFYHPTPTTTSVLLQVDWHAQQKPTVDYKVLLRLTDADGAILDEANDYPIGPLLPPTTWNVDDFKPGYFVLQLPNDLTDGRYLIQLSLYDANTLTHAPHTAIPAADAPDHDVAKTQPLTLAEVRVGDTMQLLSPEK